jgi:hypothetical protein
VDCLLQLLQTDIEQETKMIVDSLGKIYDLLPKQLIDSSFSCFFHAERGSLLRLRVLKYMYKHLPGLVRKTSSNFQMRRAQINGLLKHAFTKASIGEWERLVLIMNRINEGNGKKLNLYPEEIVEILCFPYSNPNINYNSVSYFFIFIILMM